MRLNDLEAQIDMMNGRIDMMESHLGIDNEMEQEINQVDDKNYGKMGIEVEGILTMLSELTNWIPGMESSVSAVNNRVNTFESNICVRRNGNENFSELEIKFIFILHDGRKRYHQ
ncbi:hypothetical protein Glove_117g91 [Diversispora epigaea]|uniref:t-SNARE coiled-coil homology domain-containing protein n=1 Tax=Diversispora epigaea TaxID=1348612 RepID=A0A397J463_9GLOM|nr:hypothetical protein Glove_117g91 [Diversispora epigaea]